MRPHLIDILEYFEKKILADSRDKGAIRYHIDEVAIRANLEIIYGSATGRIAELAYFVDASIELGNIEGFKPPHDSKASDEFQIGFNGYDRMPRDLAKTLNLKMGGWTRNVVMRELCEYLHYYLLQVYETCLTIKMAGQNISPHQIQDIRKASDTFEKKGLLERLQILHKEFEVTILFRQELASIYEARHVFAHFDGYVQKKFCDHRGFLTIKWLKNKYYFVKKNGKKLPYHKTPRPINPELYIHFSIDPLSKSLEKKYAVGERISITAQDIQDLLYLFIAVFDQAHEGVVKFALANHLSVREFANYRRPMFMMMEKISPSGSNPMRSTLHGT